MTDCRCSTGAFPRPEDLTDERVIAGTATVFVVGISGMRPKTRAFVTERIWYERTWAYQTKSAFSDVVNLAVGSRPRQRDRLHSAYRASLPKLTDSITNVGRRSL